MLTTTSRAPRAPSAALALVELGRASLETSSLLLAAPFMADAPRGDGHDVVVLPGFAFSDVSTFLLRAYLRSLGYRAHDWDLGRNLGLRTLARGAAALASRIDQLSDGGRRRVSLVGHSLGGVIARQYALEYPGHVRQVICLGSPFVGDPRAVNPLVLRLHNSIAGEPPPVRRPPPRLTVPFTAIFSRSDGIVAPSDCTDADGEEAENIEVFSSHCGLVSHPAVFYAVADRLALPVGQWRPFQAHGWRKAFFGPSRPTVDDVAEAA
ncbi:MAG: alpha/beta hydrolase [Caulobacteraceae bacterium]|nr:alpha/beta hydrolase [Caulobacteraceae bacterium]